MNSLDDNLSTKEGSFMYKLHETDTFDCTFYKGFCSQIYQCFVKNIEKNEMNLTLVGDLIHISDYIKKSIIYDLSATPDELRFIFNDGSLGGFNELLDKYDEPNDFIGIIEILLKNYLHGYVMKNDLFEEVFLEKN